MKELYTTGKSSISFSEPIYFTSCASVAGKKEGDGPLGSCFDKIYEDSTLGCNTWETAESTMQREASEAALQKAGLSSDKIRIAFAGDLLAQTIASSFGIAGMEIPFYGLYGACSTMGEALSLGSMTIGGGYADHVLCAASSHFASAEKEFRFPLGYGNQRPLSASWTVTGSAACILSRTAPRKTESHTAPLRKGNLCTAITGITTGRMIDYGLKDSMNMGGCMAPAACDTIYRNLSDFGREPSYYDAIFTGDLGYIGQRILLDLLLKKGIDITEQHQDCGILIFDQDTQDTHAGGSGCGCCAIVLAGYILPNILSGKWKRVLFVPTGALLSKVSFNEGDSVPGIAHAVVIEQMEV